MIRRPWILIKYLWGIRFLRFLVVGSLNTAFGYSVYALLLFTGLHFALASLFTQICSVLFNFKTTGILVFRSKNNWLIFKYFGSYFITYLINIGLLTMMTQRGMGAFTAGAITAMPLALLSYYLNVTFVFRCITIDNPTKKSRTDTSSPEDKNA